MERFWFFQQMHFYWDVGIRLCELLTQDEAIQKIIKSTEQKFDIIIISTFIQDCIFGISHMLDVPIIKMCPFVGTKWMDESVGNPSTYAYVPNVFSGYGERMNFWQRTLNTLSEIYMKLGRVLYVIPQHDAILRKRFSSTNIPSISVLEKNHSLTND
jgi:hypothetical protein